MLFRSVDFNRSKLFYGFFMFQILLGLAIVMMPSVSLFKITLYADFLNGIFLPIVFFFLYKFSNSEELMGEYKNTRLKNFLLITAGVVITVASLVGGIGKFFF